MFSEDVFLGFWMFEVWQEEWRQFPSDDTLGGPAGTFRGFEPVCHMCNGFALVFSQVIRHDAACADCRY